MSWLLILSLILSGGFVYLLFAPFYLELNSTSGLCRIRFHYWASATLVMADSSLKMDLRVAGWKKQIGLFAAGKQKENVRNAKKKRKKGRNSFDLVKAVMKSFKVNKCDLAIDTGDRQLNGILYPFFYFSGKYLDKNIQINFLNKNEIILEVENNFARIIKAFIFH